MARSIQKVAPTPLETLTEMNRALYQKRKKRRPARPSRKDESVEVFYRGQLRSLVRLINQVIAAEVMPVVKQEKPAYTGDALTMDGWAERVRAALQAAADQFTTATFAAQAERVAQDMVRRADAVSTGAFVESVNRAIGVDLSNMIDSERLQEELEAAVAENISLIRSIPQQHFTRLESIVLNGMRNGQTPTTIANNIRELSGVTYRRARFIARDQVAKLNGDITEARQSAAGITHYRAVDAGDERVTGRPGGRYPNAKIKCWEIARRDIGYGPGVYTWKEGASYAGQKGLHPGKHHPGCRCTATPVFEWELPD
ncbi:phage minor head protein [Alloalcanivorax xenomutans]|uniref:phage minor head protein n=1 Tax=Alloalcanivorax xenomutans TaxID=1094342 RepID=UPI001C6FC9F8|nr:phage minor head protein [Alloalcanivorax xenomutans]